MNKANPDSFTQLSFDRRREMAYFTELKFILFLLATLMQVDLLDDYKQAYEDYKSSGLSRAKGTWQQLYVMATMVYQ